MNDQVTATEEVTPPAVDEPVEGTAPVTPEVIEPTEPPTPKREPWHQTRINELTKARREAERRADALEAMLNAQSQGTQNPAPQTQNNVVDPYALAKDIAKNQRLNEAADSAYEAGKAAYPDFDSAVTQLAQVADLSKRPDFLEALTSLPNAHQVFYELGKNPDEAAHVLSLTPVKMALSLATMSAKVGRPKPATQSKAPPPVTPLGQSAAPSDTLHDDLPIAEWMARRKAQKDALRKR